MRRNDAQLLASSAIAGGPWIAGAFVDGDARLALWAVAVVVDYAAPVHGFALPAAGRTPIQAWGSLDGPTFGGLAATAQTVAAFVAGFLLTAALWWLYFAGAADSARMGRAGYAYAHAIEVVGWPWDCVA